MRFFQWSKRQSEFVQFAAPRTVVVRVQLTNDSTFELFESSGEIIVGVAEGTLTITPLGGRRIALRASK